MPLISVQSSGAAPLDPTRLLRELSRELAALLGKPERYVMTRLACAVPMTFAADSAPCCYVEVKSIGPLSADAPRRISASVCALLERELGVDPERIYIGFEEVQARLWGWNGDTFA